MPLKIIIMEEKINIPTPVLGNNSEHYENGNGKRKVNIFAIVNFLIIISLTALFLVAFMKTIKDKSVLEKVCYQDYCFFVNIANSQEERAQGLMFIKKLKQNRGMLFTFEKDGDYAFWMKNTLIPLDIIWLDKDGNVVSVAKNTQPCKYDPCEKFKSDVPARFVLEINAGMAEKLGISPGSKISLPKI